MDPRDTYRVTNTVASQMVRANTATSGMKYSRIPRPVATPLPPLNPHIQEKLCPRMAQVAHRISTVKSEET